MNPKRYNENVKLVVEEAASPEQSLAARHAKRELASLCRDLPEVLRHMTLTSPMGAGDNDGRLARSYASAAVREITAVEKDRLSDLDKIHAINNAVKAVIVQEAAGSILHARDPSQSADSFEGLKKSHPTVVNDPGKSAIVALKQMGLDAHEFFRDFDIKDMRAVRAGEFHRVQEKNLDRMINLLQVPGNEVYTLAQGPKVPGNDYGPVENAPQCQHRIQAEATRQRQPSFAQRMIVSRESAMAITGS